MPLETPFTRCSCCLPKLSNLLPLRPQLPFPLLPTLLLLLLTPVPQLQPH